MADLYGDSSSKYSTVAKWSAEFKRGRDSGRPVDVISQLIIDCVERLVLNDRRINVAELAFDLCTLTTLNLVFQMEMSTL